MNDDRKSIISICESNYIACICRFCGKKCSGLFKCELSPRSAAAWLDAGACLSRLSKAPDALKHIEHASSLGIQSGVLHEAVGDAHFQMGNFNEANDAYAKLANRGEASPLSEAKRGASEVHLGLIETGLSRMQRAISSASRCG